MKIQSNIWHRQLRGDPGDLARRAGVLFIVGSTCFALGAFPPYFLNATAQAVGVTFFIGSVFFTSAGLTQLLGFNRESGRLVQPGSKTWWALAVQLAGMIFFNVNTFRAGFVDVPSDEVNRLIWAPDFFGSVAFLVASHLAWLAVCGTLWCVRETSSDWWMAGLNYVGSVFFMLSALGAFFLETTGEVVNITLVNAGTFLGAVCFILGAYLLLPVHEQPLAASGS
jgi:hypothetical protein